MDSKDNFWLAYALSAFGAILLALMTISPETARTNLSGWLHLLGATLSPLNAWLVIATMVLAVATVVLGVFTFALGRRAGVTAVVKELEDSIRRPVGTGHP